MTLVLAAACAWVCPASPNFVFTAVTALAALAVLAVLAVFAGLAALHSTLHMNILFERY